MPQEKNNNEEIRAYKDALKQAQRQAKLGQYALVNLQKTKHELLLYRVIFQKAPVAILITDQNGIITNTNKSFTEITGYSYEESINKNPSFLKSDKHDSEFFKEFWNTLLKDGFWQGEIWNRRKSGELYVEWLSINSIKDEENNVTNYIGIFRDTTVTRKKMDQLEKFAYIDPLTKLPNRRACEEQIESYLKLAEINNNPLAVLFMDLDHFKEVNDTYGHKIGDLLLTEIGTRLKACVRKDDIVARISGDEFIVVLKGITDNNKIKEISNNIIKSVNQDIILENNKCNVGISIGISLYPTDANSATKLIKMADEAMYSSKSSGRNRLKFYFEL